MTGAGKRAFWDFTICGAGLVYVGLALFVNLDSPIFALVLIVLAGYQLVGGRGQAKPPATPPKT